MFWPLFFDREGREKIERTGDFGQEDMGYFRRRMVLEILNRTLLAEEQDAV